MQGPDTERMATRFFDREFTPTRETRRGTRAEWMAFADVMATATAKLRELARGPGDLRMRAHVRNAEDFLEEILTDARASW